MIFVDEIEDEVPLPPIRVVIRTVECRWNKVEVIEFVLTRQCLQSDQ